MTPTTPIDATHAASLEAVRQIRRRLEQCRRYIAVWQPAPCPKEWS